MMGELARFFDAIADKKGCDYEIDNPVFMGGQEHVEVKYQAGKFVPLSNGDIDEINKDQLFADIFQKGNKRIILIRSISKRRFKGKCKTV